MNGQTSLFDCGRPLRIDKPLRLIELFAGIGAQAKAFENLGFPFEHYRICEFDRFAVKAYNAVHGTDFTVSDITKIHAEDLGVVDTDQYCYMMTYSFPCTDLSKAGAQKGMSRGSGTRSGLLWEVERLLREMTELPQFLLMENVPDVVSEKNIEDFREWVWFLNSLGYTSHYEILNAKDYGVPQNRERCYMLSWLGEGDYSFPQPIPLTVKLRDVLEPHADRRYYLPDRQARKLLMNDRTREREREMWLTPSERAGGQALTDMRGTRCVWMTTHSIEKEKDYSVTLCARDYKGLQNLRPMTGVIEGGDGLYVGDSQRFHCDPLPGLSRTIKAGIHDAGVVLYE